MSDERGILDLIWGPMFSGKTTEVLRRAFVEAEIGMKVLYINHSFDDRTDEPFSTHNPLYKERLSTHTHIDFLKTADLNSVDVKGYDVIVIDEAQFFEDLALCVKLLVDLCRKHVIVCGLIGDYQRKTFGSISELLPLADSCTMLTSHCRECAKYKIRTPAPFVHRFSGGDSKVEVGAGDKYIPVCRKCYLSLNQS